MQTVLEISFGSDNHAPVHPAVMEALQKANNGYVPAYGNDWYTQHAREIFAEQCGECDVFFMFNGTASNVVGLSAMLQSHQAVIAPESAHIHVDECGAFEKHTGSKILTMKTGDGKLRVSDIEPFMEHVGFVHNVQPKVISVTQATEYGTVYSTDELAILSAYAHKHNMLVHMDGNRLYNAAAYLGTSLKELTKDVGVDVLSLGGTKNGLMWGEAVVFFNKSLAQDFIYRQKQSMQLFSKMRYAAVQFSALLQNNIWLANALQANAMAQKLADGISKCSTVKITQPVQANAVFVQMPLSLIKHLQEKFCFYVWNEANLEVRLMTSWSTRQQDIDFFLEYLSQKNNF